MTAAQPPTTESPTLQLTRWTVTSSSNAQSRGAVVMEAGAHHWRASAEGNGAVDALFKAVDAALVDDSRIAGSAIGLAAGCAWCLAG